MAFFIHQNLPMDKNSNAFEEIKTLISKNKKRLLLEIKESKELFKLIGQSTQRSLTDEEQKQVNRQLLDVFKTIPSLAIFMLPGGALLLPLAIKFIPNLLPSAFNRPIDDTDEEE